MNLEASDHRRRARYRHARPSPMHRNLSTAAASSQAGERHVEMVAKDGGAIDVHLLRP